MKQLPLDATEGLSFTYWIASIHIHATLTVPHDAAPMPDCVTRFVRWRGHFPHE